MKNKDNLKKKRWRFSFKKLLVLYLVGIVGIVIAIVFAWPKWTKYKQKMGEEHNAKAGQLFNWNTTDKDLMKLRKLTFATKLNLIFTKISDAGLVHLKPLTHLTHLNLIFTKISDAGLVHLKSLTHLTSLHLARTKISDAGCISNLLLISLPFIWLEQK